MTKQTVICQKKSPEVKRRKRPRRGRKKSNADKPPGGRGRGRGRNTKGIVNETAIVPYETAIVTAPPSQELNLQEEPDKADAVQNNAPDDDMVAYLEHEKKLDEKYHDDNESGPSSDSEKSNKDYSGSTSEDSGDSGS